MRKALIVSTVSRQFYLFEKGNIDLLHKLGYEVHCAANYSDENQRLDELTIIRHHFDIQRSPFSIKNVRAYRQLKKLMKEMSFDLVHCHSPMGGILARLTALRTNTKPVIYTAHGFHFYKGASFVNTLIYKNIEKIMARYTDGLITINQEDFEAASAFKLRKGGQAFYVPGIGVNTGKISDISVDFKKKRNELGIGEDACVALSIGEFIPRKNYETALRSFAKANHDNLYYLICGRGALEHQLKELTKELQIADRVIFAGFRSDIDEIVKISDIFLFPSFQEGLPVSTMEAMSAGLPCLVSRIRGNVDLIEEGKGGYLFEPTDIDGFSKALRKLSQNQNLRRKMGECNKSAVKKFDIENVKKIMVEIYNQFSGDCR